MKRLKVLFCQRWLGQQQGGVMVEFAIVLPVLLLLVFGIIDFGHALYLKAEVTSASREGARYATRYQTDNNGQHILPASLSPNVSTWVTNNYAGLLPTDADLTVPPPTGPGYTSGLAGQDVTVTVQATKRWFILGTLVPGLGNTLQLQSTTVMKCE